MQRLRVPIHAVESVNKRRVSKVAGDGSIFRGVEGNRSCEGGIARVAVVNPSLGMYVEGQLERGPDDDAVLVDRCSERRESPPSPRISPGHAQSPSPCMNPGMSGNSVVLTS